MQLDRIREACDLTHKHVGTMAAARRKRVSRIEVVFGDRAEPRRRRPFVRIAVAAGFSFLALVLCR